MDEDWTTVKPTNNEEDVQIIVKELKDYITQKNNKIVELEHDINKKEDDNTNLKMEVDYLKIQVTST